MSVERLATSEPTSNAERRTSNAESRPTIMNLNHIFLFLAIVSPLLVLVRAWRPGAPYHGWRLAALIVLAVTAVAWLLWPDASGYLGGAAWFLLLFLPAIGLRKVSQLAAQGDYES